MQGDQSVLFLWDRNGQRVFNGPSFLQSRIQVLMARTEHVGPVAHTERLPLKRQQAIGPLISVLYVCQCPIRIVLCITEVVIASLDRMLGARARPDITIELHKRLLPCWAYGNTPSPIQGKRRIIGARTSPTHIMPCPIFRQMTQAVSPYTLPGLFFGPTATATTCALTQALFTNAPQRPAGASTAPKRLSIGGLHVRSLYDKPALKCLSSKVNRCSHDTSFSGARDGSQVRSARRAPRLGSRGRPDYRMSLAERVRA